MRTKANSLPPLSRSLTRKHMWLNTQPRQGRRTGAIACIYNAVLSTSTNTNANTGLQIGMRLRVRSKHEYEYAYEASLYRRVTTWFQHNRKWIAEVMQCLLRRSCLHKPKAQNADSTDGYRGFWGSSERPQTAKGAPMEVTMHCYSLVNFLTTLVFV